MRQAAAALLASLMPRSDGCLSADPSPGVERMQSKMTSGLRLCRSSMSFPRPAASQDRHWPCPAERTSCGTSPSNNANANVLSQRTTARHQPHQRPPEHRRLSQSWTAHKGMCGFTVHMQDLATKRCCIEHQPCSVHVNSICSNANPCKAQCGLRKPYRPCGT